MNSKKAIVLMVGIVCLVLVFGELLASAAEQSAMELSQLTLRHPRRGHRLTALDGKIWVTGGRAYYSHFTKWGQEGFAEYDDFPNVEYIDLAKGEVVYTKISLGTENIKEKELYKTSAFAVSPDSPFIYIGGKKVLLRLDTTKLDAPEKAITELDPGEKGDWQEASVGKMTIGGKDYVVLISADGVFFFDGAQEKFVTVEGMDTDLPYDGIEEGFWGCVINNIYYVFGGLAEGDVGTTEAWKFDPSQPSGKQWARIADMPIGIESPRVETVNGKAYILGGGTAGAYFRTVLEYDPATDIYTRKTDLSFPVQNHGFAAVGDTIWVSYGYTWGTEEEGKYGFRMHPAHIVTYTPAKDSAVLAFEKRDSVSGEYLNVNITWPDADHITGDAQTIAVNWTASTESTKGLLSYRKKGDEQFTTLEATGEAYTMAMEEAKSYVAVVTGLPPDTEYEYKVTSEGPTTVESPVYTYKTQPANPETFHFVMYGDAKAQYDINHELNCDILDTFNKMGHSGWFSMLGDFGAQGAFQEWNAWFNYTYNGRTCSKDLTAQYALLPIHGNHEMLAPSFFDNVALPQKAMTGWPDLNNAGDEEYWFSFNYGRLHVAVLLTGEYKGQAWFDQHQLEWLKQDLAKAKAEKEAGNLDWVIVAAHHSVFTSGEHFLDANAYAMFDEGYYVDVIEASGAVDMVFGAHDHDYERTKNIRGFRWKADGGNGEPAFYKLDGATVEETSGQFGTATQGKGTIWIVAGGAGAGQRGTYPFEKIGEASQIAFRKPAPERGEDAPTHPVYHYALVTASKDELKVEVFEKSIAYLPDWKGADDDFTGLLDSITLRR